MKRPKKISVDKTDNTRRNKSKYISERREVQKIEVLGQPIQSKRDLPK